MNRSVRARIALLASNAALVALLALAARETFFTWHEAHLPRLLPGELAVSTEAREDGAAFSVIWKELDHVPPAEKKPEPRRVEGPGLDALLRVTLVAVDPLDGRATSCIVQTVATGEQRLLRAGETREGWACTSIDSEGEEWLVALRDPKGATARLRLERERPRAR